VTLDAGTQGILRLLICLPVQKTSLTALLNLKLTGINEETNSTELRGKIACFSSNSLMLFRGCTSHKSVEPPTKADNCETYLSNTNGQWSQKTCAVSCDSVVLGCNDNNDIYDLFSTSKVSRCHSCHLSERPGEFIFI